MYETTDIVVNNITLKNSPMFNIALPHGRNVHIFNVSIINPDSFSAVNPSHNTDGVNLYGVENVLIENSYISTGKNTTYHEKTRKNRFSRFSIS